MMSVFVKIFFLILLVVTHFLFLKKVHGFVKDPIYDDLEGPALVRALLKDGKLDLAEEEIKSLQKPDETNLLKGQLNYLKNQWPQALKEFSKISNQSEFFAESQMGLARTYYQAKDYKNCQKSYLQIATNKYAQELDSIWKSSCEKQIKKYDEAWQTLLSARKIYASYNIEVEMIQLQLDLKMHHEALLTTLQWFSKHLSPATHYLNVAEMFQVAKSEQGALTVLEMARAQHPAHMDINLALSQVYFQKGMLSAAEEGFRRAALSDGKYYYHSAELNRQTRHYERSLYLNALVVDEKERLKQKIATYVDANKYSLIASLDAVIQRSELQKDDEVKYALAYSLVRVGNYEKPLKYLSQITKPELIEKTTVLRQTLLECQEKKEACRL
ncbi:hypothetical protein K2X05_10570 [bacterium]|nr:hypothetical protein [bacterium]